MPANMGKLRYSEFAHSIDVDQFEGAIGFEPAEHTRGFDIGHCPDPWGLHKNGDTTGKFGIHREARTFNCFVCGGGTLLSLTMALKDYDEEQAIDFLHEFTSPVDLTDEDFLSEIDAILAVEKQKKPAPPYFNEHVLDKWTGARGLCTFDMDQFRQGRGISLEVAQRFRIGFDPEHVRRSKSKGEYVGPAIILPHFFGGRLVGWQARWLDDDRPKWVPKYTNTHDFPREGTLFNFEGVYLSPEPIVVVESVPTVLMLVSQGIPAVATFGSNVSAEQARLLGKYQQGVILAPDNDAPGRKWITADPEKPCLAQQLERFVPVGVAEVGGDEGDDLGDHREDAVDILAAAQYWMG